MLLPFVDRRASLGRIQRALAARTSELVCVYGRRRLGKSRLITQALEGRRAVYYLADERDELLQRRALAREIERLIPGFARVEYPDWDALFDRWSEAAPRSAVLAIDELPYLVSAVPALPSMLQRRIDRGVGTQHWVLCGSSQRMMHGIVLDAAAPLYGRARELIKVEPLPCPYLGEALQLRGAEQVVEAFASWGGVPRYWELARGAPSLTAARRELILDPAGALHAEPRRLLLDELRETTQAHSILSLVGQGCHRLSEIAGRLERPASSLTRPLALLVDLGFVRREIPHGEHPRRSKRSRYRIADPFLRYWYRFVDPNRSVLEAGHLDAVEAPAAWSSHLAEIWEDLVREAVPRIGLGGERWGPASAWWGRTSGARDTELDVVATSLDDPEHLLVGEVKLALSGADVPRMLRELDAKAHASPWARGKRLTLNLFALRQRGRRLPQVVTATDVLARWRAAEEAA